MAQTWVYDNFGSQADAVSFLNTDARQGPGEACASARNDGSVGLIFLEPGSLGASTALTWVYDNFGSQADAVSFLNTDARQGPGEASTTLRGDGSVGCSSSSRVPRAATPRRRGRPKISPAWRMRSRFLMGSRG